MKKRFHYFNRQAERGKPAGITVSKRKKLPSGNFGITEYLWRDHGWVALWFIDMHKFTADERQQAYREHVGV